MPGFYTRDYYPHLVRLYRSIGVQFYDADNTLSCFDVKFDSKRPSRDAHSKYAHQDRSNQPSSTTTTTTIAAPLFRVQEPYLSSRSYKVGSHTITLPDLPPFSLLNPFPFGRRILGYVRIAYDYLRMVMISKEFLAKGRMMDIGKHPIEWGNGRSISLREFLEAGGYSPEFSAFFVPIFASVCTCSFERMMEYPACVVLEYVARCMPFGRMQFVTNGVQDVVERLARNVGTIHYNTRIVRVMERRGRAAAPGEDGQGPIALVDAKDVERSFDHVIFATQANQAVATLIGHSSSVSDDDHSHTEESAPFSLSAELLKTIKPSHPFYQQIKTLIKFPYERTRVVCHTDRSFLPKNPAHWRLLNIAKSSAADVLASPLNMISKELEQEMELRSRKAKMPRPSIFSLKPPSSSTSAMILGPGTHNSSSNINSGNRMKLTAQRKTSHPRLRAHFAPLLPTGHSTSTARPSLSAKTTTKASQRHNSAMATHIMSSTPTTQFLQTTNPLFPPRPETVLSSTWFERAVVNPSSMKAVDELQLMMEQQTERWVDWHERARTPEYQKNQNQGELLESINHEQEEEEEEEEEEEVEEEEKEEEEEVPVADRVWFVGSFAYPGIPLLEGCVVSAIQVVERIQALDPTLQLAPVPVSPPPSSSSSPSSPCLATKQNGLQELRSRTTRTYFQTAWKSDALLDDNNNDDDDYNDDQGQGDDHRSSRRSQGGHGLSSWSSRVYAQVAWMLMLYAAAILKWWFVIVVESLGGDGSRWALA
ncbi:hypothetical protein EDD11_005739 [Mortierella claussenii]|nr:hypothetical protein EDD11_005739 [Mortierella claussenii]